MAPRFPQRIVVRRPKQSAVYVIPRARLAAFQEAVRRGVRPGLELEIQPLSANGQGQPTHYVLEVDGHEIYPGYSPILSALEGIKTKFPLVDKYNARNAAGQRLTFDEVMAKAGRTLKKVR